MPWHGSSLLLGSWTQLSNVIRDSSCRHHTECDRPRSSQRLQPALTRSRICSLVQVETKHLHPALLQSGVSAHGFAGSSFTCMWRRALKAASDYLAAGKELSHFLLPAPAIVCTSFDTAVHTKQATLKLLELLLHGPLI